MPARLLEAARCADIEPVRVKSVEQQALQGLHRTRSLWMGTRTSRINALRGFCREFGLAIPQGARTGVEAISRVLADPQFADPRTDPWLDEAAGRGDPPAGTAHRPAGTGTGRAGQAQPGLHDAADDSRHRPADRHGHGGRHRRRRVALQGRPALRQLVRPDAQGVSLGQQSRLGRISKTGDRYLRMLLTHGARAVLRAATVAAQAGADVDGLRTWALGGAGAAPITTRPPARWPTSWRASAMPCCAMQPYGSPAPGSKKIERHGFAIAS